MGRFGGIAYWIFLEGERLYCFDAVAAADAPQMGLPTREDFPEIRQTLIPRALTERVERFASEPAGASVLVPLRGHRGHDLGYVGLTVSPGRALPDPDQLRKIVHEEPAVGIEPQSVTGGVR